MLRPDSAEILLVEDNPDEAELTIRALRGHGLTGRLWVAGDGEAALDFLFGTGAYATRGRPSALKVVLLDLELPKLNGLDVLRRIKSNDSTRLIPVVMLSSAREERDLVASYRLGANSYVVKPVEFDRFVECVSRLVTYWLRCNEPPPPGSAPPSRER